MWSSLFFSSRFFFFSTVSPRSRWFYFLRQIYYVRLHVTSLREYITPKCKAFPWFIIHTFLLLRNSSRVTDSAQTQTSHKNNINRCHQCQFRNLSSREKKITKGCAQFVLQNNLKMTVKDSKRYSTDMFVTCHQNVMLMFMKST